MRRVAVLVVLLAVLAGCSSDPGPAPAVPSVAPATDTPFYGSAQELRAATDRGFRHAGSVRVKFTGSSRAVSTGGFATFSGTGTMRVDDAGRALQLTVTQQRAAAPAQVLEVVAVPGAVFVKPNGPPASATATAATSAPRSAAGGDRPWLRIDPASTDPRVRPWEPLLTQLRVLADPVASAVTGDRVEPYFRGPSGEEPVEGVPGLRYSTGGPVGAPPGELIDINRTGNVNLDVWVGAQDRLLRLRLDRTGPAGLLSEGTYTGWGSR